MAAPTKTLTAACHCRNVQFTITLPTASLPLNINLCHCTICRYVHGAPCCFHAPLPVGVDLEFIAPSSMDQLTSYTHPSFQSTKWFCTNCGCHIGDQSLTDVEWVISTSIFDANREEEGVWKFQTHYCPGSAADGGLSSVFSTVDGHQLRMIDPEPAPASQVAGTEEGEGEGDRDEDEDLLAQCHCGGVSFRIARPRDEFIASSASTGWLSPIDPKRWLASMDVCDDCRLVTGTNVIGWMFVPVDHVSPRPPADLLIGSSKGYRSTEDVLRTFCGTCGATVLYWCAERPQIVDVATGLLRAREGVMAEKWAVWRANRPAWPENGLRYHGGFSRALIEGMKRWGTERGHAQEFVVP
ncbi:uncharacterized protein N7482_001328 [Penicillium canariense]|uniref:CENP-V/GFA domain-containing protein n=1 Tax=Penicillium canariense TaxID=189055 RepID=A0A9W9IJJ7_9EURO|nr:uncharacterized protein N7482_001328 [Penicillium canariense]KAJ5175451.1 hypothetical protein N7482_001328 [Penicillium canariense]